MKTYRIKGNYKGLELSLGTVATLSNNLEELKEIVKEKHGVSDVVLEEITLARPSVEETLPW